MSDQREELAAKIVDNVAETFVACVNDGEWGDWLTDHRAKRVIETTKDLAGWVNPDLEPGRWWRVTAPDGSLWMETSNEAEAREGMRPGDRLERLYVAQVSEWRTAPPETDWPQEVHR